MAFAPLFHFRAVKDFQEIPFNDEEGLSLAYAVPFMGHSGLPRKYTFEETFIASHIWQGERLFGYNTDILSIDTEFPRFIIPITGYGRLYISNSTPEFRVERVKRSIAGGEPVIIGFNPPDSFKIAGDYWAPERNDIDDPDNGHAVCVIGYDDKKYGGAFEIMNSWGEEWGNGGFTWISYETFGKWVDEAWVINEDISIYMDSFEYNGKVNVELAGKSESPSLKLLQDGIYRLSTTVIPGTRIRLNAENINLPARNNVHTYMFYTDAQHSKLVRAVNGEWINTNEATKAENIIVLFSRTQLDVNSIISNFERATGSISNRLERVLGNGFIRFSNSDYLYDSMQITSSFINTRAVAAMVLSIQYDSTEKPVSDMVRVTGGSFQIGSPTSERGRFNHETQRRVTLNDFFIKSTEVTVGEFSEFINNTRYITTAERAGKSNYYNYISGKIVEHNGFNWKNPGFTQDNNHPVVHISFFDAVEYCNWLSLREGLTPVYTISGNNIRVNTNANGYRLPSSSEWEVACRAGTTTPFNTGTSINSNQANISSALLFKTTSVRRYAPNQLGLYNMHGNVLEWCSDIIYNEQIIRGSSWVFPISYVRSAYFDCAPRNTTMIDLGFRIARNAD